MLGKVQTRSLNPAACIAKPHSQSVKSTRASETSLVWSSLGTTLLDWIQSSRLVQVRWVSASLGFVHPTFISDTDRLHSVSNTSYSMFPSANCGICAVIQFWASSSHSEVYLGGLWSGEKRRELRVHQPPIDCPLGASMVGSGDLVAVRKQTSPYTGHPTFLLRLAAR